MVWHLGAKPAFGTTTPNEFAAFFGFWEGFLEFVAGLVETVFHGDVTVDAVVSGAVGVIDFVLEIGLFFVVEIFLIELIDVVSASRIQIGLEFGFIRGLVVSSVLFGFLLVGQNLIGGFRFEGS